MNPVLRWSSRIFDAMEHRWEGERMRQGTATVLIGSFFLAILVIECNRQGWLPDPMGGMLPTNHFHAFDVAFTLFLGVEILGLVFGLATSVADALGKQFEIFSLIMLRQSFKELVYFEEPITWTLADETARQAVQYILSDTFGALTVFALMGLYASMQRHRRITGSDAEQRRFVAAKKAIANALFVCFVGLVGYAAYAFVTTGETMALFSTFYTVLIFSDVLIVLVSYRYSATYHVVFRNFGFAAATVLLRLALAGPHYGRAVLGIGAALFAVGLTAAYNYVAPSVPDPEVPGEHVDTLVETPGGDDDGTTG